MALYRCKFPINDPLLEIYQAINLRSASSRKSTFRHVRTNCATSGFEKDETILRLRNETLPIEYNFTDLIGLELRQAQIATQGEKYEQVVELLVADRKLIFFLADLEEIHYDS